MSTGQTASLNGFVPFTAGNLWNTDVSTAAVDPNSTAIMTNWVGSVNVHPDWGNDPTYGIPYVVVDGNQSLVKVNLQAYGDESDPGPMPVPANALVEGGSSSTGDRHVLVLDNGNCFLYELYNSSVNGDGSWNADSTAVWDLLSDEQRPYQWTSVPRACQSSPVWCDMAKSPQERFSTPSGSHSRNARGIHPARLALGSQHQRPERAADGMRLRLKSS
jgi:hypothetical protein